MQAFRIAIIGPEAAGKTELAAILAQHFGGTATEEYARRYFAEHALPADYVLNVEEMRAVMEGQRQAEQGSGLRFIDASTIHGPIYAAMLRKETGELAFDFSSVDAQIMDYATAGGYDAFVLCHPHAELEWIDDGMRSMPHLTDRLAFADACTAFVAKHHSEKPCIVVNAPTWLNRELQAIAGITSLIG